MSLSSSARAAKKSAFSCESCRKRKVKCDGEKPTCNRCASRNDECVYKLNPTLSYTQRLEERIKELEDQLETVSKSPSVADSNHSSPSVLGSQDSQAIHSRASVDDQSVARSFRGLKIDDQGTITYHGSTSFFHLPSDRLTDRTDPLTSSDDIQRRARLVSNAWQQRALENLSEIPEPFQYLLNVHWCWIQPMFNFIYRPAFTRDMQAMGPYYSHTLLNAVLSHSTRFGSSDPATSKLLEESYDNGAVFAKHARSMLFDELSRGICTVPTIQSLLVLSAQECSLGNSTQAWTYSGLAFRLIDHLGILFDVQHYEGSVALSDEDIEIRHRVFWSCYFWDKMISLYLGRSPSLQHSTISPPQTIFDDSAENEAWAPFGAPPVGRSWDYAPTMANSASCFLSVCRLSVIFNKILVHMYDPVLENTEAEMRECLHTQEAALQQWWDQLAPRLRVDPTSLPPRAPPSHIVTLNCLYHTFKILLYRPMLTRGGTNRSSEERGSIHNYLIECVTSATSILIIFNLFRRTFSINYCILSVSYSLYIAASIFLLQVQAVPEDGQALRRLEFCIQALEQVKKINPVIVSALGLIKKEIAVLGIILDPVVEQPEQQSQTPVSVSMGGPMYQMTTAAPQHVVVPEQHAFDTPWENLGPQSMAVDPEVFKTMSSLQPLSVRVGGIEEEDQQGPFGE